MGPTWVLQQGHAYVEMRHYVHYVECISVLPWLLCGLYDGLTLADMWTV